MLALSLLLMLADRERRFELTNPATWKISREADKDRAKRFQPFFWPFSNAGRWMQLSVALLPCFVENPLDKRASGLLDRTCQVKFESLEGLESDSGRIWIDENQGAREATTTKHSREHPL
jgi:hypothetical protein